MDAAAPIPGPLSQEIVNAVIRQRDQALNGQAIAEANLAIVRQQLETLRARIAELERPAEEPAENE